MVAERKVEMMGLVEVPKQEAIEAIRLVEVAKQEEPAIEVIGLVVEVEVEVEERGDAPPPRPVDEVPPIELSRVMNRSLFHILLLRRERRKELYWKAKVIYSNRYCSHCR